MNYTKYDLMNFSEEVDELGNQYPDIMTYPLNRFRPIYSQYERLMPKTDIDRFDLFTYYFYNTANLDDFLLWYNDNPTINLVEIGDTLNVPDRRDVEKFYLDNIK